MSQRLRIGVYLDTWDFGGIAAFCENLAQGLAERGHDVTLVLGRDYKRGDANARGAYEEMNVRRHFQLEVLDFRKWPRRQRPVRVCEALRDAAFDVLFINNFDPLVSCFNTLAASVRLVSIGHGDHSHCYSQFLSTQYFAHRHIAISRAIQEQCREMCPPNFRENVVLIHHGVPWTALPSSTRETLAGPLRVCYCGRFDFTDKRLQDLPPVWRAFQRLGGTGRLTLIGEGDVRGWLESEFAKEREYGEIIFTGRLSGDELAQVLNAQEVFLSLSNWEGLGLASVEAAMHGVYPVLSAVRSGHRDVVSMLESGTLCPVGDIEAFARALRDCEKNRESLAATRTSRAETANARFGLTRMLDAYEELARTVMNEPLRAPVTHLGRVRTTLSPAQRWWGDLAARFRRTR